jgi:hypothetical protein
LSAFEPHVVAVEWVGINSGLSSTMNQISGGMTNLARQQNSVGNQMGRTFGYWSQQMRVMRRSAEYMLAGFASYKVIQAFQNYKQFRSELGTLNANLNVGQGALNEWGRTAIDVSNKTATPLNQVVESFQNLAASFPEISKKAKAHLFPIMAEIEAKASNILSTSSGSSSVQPQQFGATVLQAARSFYGAQRVERSVARNPSGRNALETTASQVLTALMRTPGTTGSQLVSYLPTLFGGARAGRFSIPEAMAMFTVAQRVGGRPAQTIQYLRQLMLRIRRPTAQEAPYFKQAGIDLNNIGSYGGMQIIQALLGHAASLPGGVTKQQIQQMMRQGNTQGVNLSGQAAQFLQNAVGGRIQSLIAMTQLSTGMGDLNKQVDIYKHHLVDVNKAYTRWEAQNQLTVAANEMSNFSTTLINSFNPLITTLAKTTGHLAKWGTDLVSTTSRAAGFVNRHTGHALSYAGDLGLLYALRAGLPPGIGNALGKIPGAGRILKPLFQMTQREKGFFGRVLGRGAGEAGTAVEESAVGPGILSQAFSKVISGPLDIRAMASALGGQANGSPAAPFWVVIHPLSKATVPGLFGYGPNSPSGLENKIKTSIEKKGEQLGIDFAKKGAEGEIASRALGKGSLFGRVFSRVGSIPGLSRLGRLGRLGAMGARLGPLAEALGVLGIPAAAYGVATQPGNLTSKLTLGAFGSGSGSIYHTPNMHGFVWSRIPGMEMSRRVRAGSVLGRYLTETDGKIPLGLQPLVGEFNQRKVSQARVERAIMHYARSNLMSGALSKHMTSGQASAFYRYVDPIFNLGNKTSFIHRATQSGGYMQGYADLTVELQPTQELKDLIKPPQRKVHVRVPIGNAPTQRGGRPTHRNK